MAEGIGSDRKSLKITSLSRKYATYFLLLLVLVLGAVLGGAGYFALQAATRLQNDLQGFIKAEETARQKEALHATATYLRSRLFNPLYNLSIEKLNEEIAQVKGWLPVSSFMVSDRTGHILTDGTPDNRFYGNTLDLSLAELAKETAIVRPLPQGLELFFVIGYDDVVAGYAHVKLTQAALQAVLRRLSTASDLLWKDYRVALFRLGLGSVIVIAALGGILGMLLSRTLSRPLVEMCEAARAYAAGRLEYTLPVRSSDELGQLARALNKLAKDLRDSQGRLVQAQRIARLGSWDWQPGNPRMYWSEEVYRIFGVQPSIFTPTVEGMLAFISVDERDSIRHYFTPPLQHDGFQLEFTLIRPGGEERIVLFQSALGTNGEQRWVGTIQDVTERKHAETQLAYLANYDALTALPNRYLFQDRLEHALRQADRTNGQLALLFVDLDRFKTINDTFGHDVGDELLKMAAWRLTDALRGSDTIARLGGDEFTVLLENIADSEEISRVASKVLTVLKQPFHLSGRQLFVSASIGIAIYPQDANDLQTLLKHADTAMYRAKEQGRAAYQFFTSALNRQVEDRLLLENALRNALEQGEFALHFQPQIQFDDGRIIGVEALLRWCPNHGDPISPADFIPILEDTGLILSVGEWVLREACGWLSHWECSGLPVPRVAVNLSGRQFQQGVLVQIIADTLAATGLSANRLELEITESVLVEQISSESMIMRLQEMGVRWAIDDFGTGYCSLSYLKRFAVDTLKIDRTFVRDVTFDDDDAAITTAIITLAHSLELTVVAEGVEFTEQATFLRQRGCDYLQGFLASSPLSALACEAWLRQQTLRDGALFWSGFDAVDFPARLAENSAAP